EYFDEVYSIDYFEKTISTFDVIVLTLPYTKETHHFFNERYLKSVKEGSILINVSRGKVLDENALLKNHERFLGIALDVFENEPLEQSNPIWNIPNLLISPHNSWVSEMRNKRRFEKIYENLRRFINKENILNKVNIKRGY
ncbi:MAG: dihydrofolate reductase, partial [Clostridiales bacterium]|nr:dihydrofolate reductase [Clostridiales bacterium]